MQVIVLTPSIKMERLHSLDSLRAIMMTLGVLLHSAPAYMGGQPGFGLPLRDPNASNYFLEWLYSIIHMFRMPIFMVIAGFFAAYLFYDRSPKLMIINRVNRVLLPFIIFIIILWPLVILSFSYSNSVFSFVNNSETNISELFISSKLTDLKKLTFFIPKMTLHLWFLYYLILFSIVSFVLGIFFKRLPSFTNKITATFNKIIQSPIKKLLIFSCLTFLILLILGRTWVGTSLSFKPNIGVYVFYFLFYIFGWILFKSKYLLDSFLIYDWIFTITGTTIFTIFFLIDTSFLSIEIITFINSITSWLFVFGITGLFLHYFSKHSSLMRYISDASYWVYLMHYPIIAILPGLIGNRNLNALLKFSIVFSLTTFSCFITYHFMVRSTFIGKFLNGRKYSRNISNLRLDKKSDKIRTQVT